MNRRRLTRPTIPAILLLILGTVATLAVYCVIRTAESGQLDADLRRKADARADAIKGGLKEAIEVLMNVNQVFQVNPDLTREQYQTFVKPLTARHPYIQAISFQRFITESERPLYERSLQANFPGVQIGQLRDGKREIAPVKPVYLVVDYLVPTATNVEALGLDVSSNPAIMRTADLARNTGLPMSTEQFRLAQEQGKQMGFLVTMPVYRIRSGKSSPASEVVGYTAAVFRSRDLVEKTLASVDLLHQFDLDLTVSMGSKGDHDDMVIHFSAEPQQNHLSWLPSTLVFDIPPALYREFEIGGQRWKIKLTATQDFVASYGRDPLSVLAIGLILSIMIATIAQTQSARALRIEALVRERTRELSVANEMLVSDNAARRRAEYALRLRERAIEASANSVAITSADGPNFAIEYVNPAFERMTGYIESEILGKPSEILWEPEIDQPGVEEIRKCGREKKEGHAILRCYRKDGTPYWSEVYLAPFEGDDGKIEHFVAIQYDITETKRYQDELEAHANHDSLTGLANRNLLTFHLANAVTRANDSGAKFWLACIDLDRFKFVNDTVGHKAGDYLLKRVAERLQSVVTPECNVARIGADEFVIVLEGFNGVTEATQILNEILAAIAEPLSYLGHEFFLTCSIGVASYPDQANDPESLLKYADVAMYRAKDEGRNNIQFYTPVMNERALERLRIERDLRSALDHQELILHYQPQVDLRTGRIVAAEALVRWRHRELGLVPPARFIGLAEETGLIVPIGEWVMREACNQMLQWRKAGYEINRVAVNLSARQFVQTDLVQTIGQILEDTKLPPQCLEIELTESLVMTDVERAIGILRRLKSLGLQLSIDDFGTGYSSLSYLKRFPIDVLKIDRSFVRDITVDPDDAAIATSIITLAHSLKLHVIAEGVETDAQLAFLRRHQCDQMQGYQFSRPVPANEFLQMLKIGKRLAPAGMELGHARGTVLVVDCEANIGSSLQRLLRPDGYLVLAATSPQQAFEMLATNRVEIVIADQRMPNMTGTEFLGRVKDLYPDTIRMMLSGFAAAESVIDAVNHGEIFRFFTKPWNDQALRQSIQEAFHHYWQTHRGQQIDTPRPALIAQG